MFLAFSLGDIVTVPFGYLLSFLYDITTNYGVALILFAILVRFILLPATAKGKKEIKAANDELKAANIDGRFKVKDAHFYSMGLANIAISATYCF